MKPIPGKIYIGRSGKPRKVERVIPGGPFGDEVVWRPILSPGKYGQERTTWLYRWLDWVETAVPELPK